MIAIYFGLNAAFRNLNIRDFQLDGCKSYYGFGASTQCAYFINDSSMIYREFECLEAIIRTRSNEFRKKHN